MMNLIAVGQPSSANDSVTISRDEQKQCITWYKEGLIKDSIIYTKDSVISVQKQFISQTDKTIEDLGLKLKEADSKYLKMRKKRRNAWIFGGSFAIVSFFSGFFLSL